MFNDYVDFKLINEDKVKSIIDDFKSYGFDCECFVNESKRIVFRLNDDLTIHDDLQKFFDWLKPVIIECAKSESNELKKQRQIRSMLLNQCELVASSFGKTIYTFSLGKRND